MSRTSFTVDITVFEKMDALKWSHFKVAISIYISNFINYYYDFLNNFIFNSFLPPEMFASSG